MRFAVCFCLLVTLSGDWASAQAQRFELPLAGFDADTSVPSIKSAYGYDWGDEISNHAQIALYLKKLNEAAPERSRLIEYGSSYENRSLNYLVISSAENIERLDEIRASNLKLADPRNCDPDQAKTLMENSPAVVWLAYCVHGNEISPSDAAMLTAYHLLADQSKETQTMLRNLVVIIDPLQNPDGRDRFVNVFRETRGLFNQSNPYSNEHTERWPSGRPNHYWFDMNRDWFRHSQQEVQAKVAAYLDWRPQIYVDAHEMGRNSTYYFPPPADPKNPYLLASQSEWFSRLGRHQAGWFDRFGFGYVTREIFDAFYPGYGSEWPTLQGGLGILWEQASARGLIVDRDDETELTYRNGVRNHYVSGLATLEFASENRRELLSGFYDSNSNAIELGKGGDVKHYFIPQTRPGRSRQFVEMMMRNGLEVGRLKSELTVKCKEVRADSKSTETFAAGTYHIAVSQPGSRLLRSLMDRSVEIDEKFLRRQLERNQLRLSSEIYDVTAWSMPLAFGIETFACSDQIDVQVEPCGFNESNFQTEFVEAKVAYLVPPSDVAIQALCCWLREGVRVHVADQPFKIGGRRYDRGTLILKVAENDPSLLEKIHFASRVLGGFEVVATDTAFVEEGAHMGGPDVRWVKPPKVLLAVNRPTNYSSGHTWYLFDQVLRYPTTRVKGADFSSVRLSDFNTIVLPDGRYSNSNGFSESVAAKLRDWVREGGTLITLRGATAWATEEKIGLLKNTRLKRKVEEPSKGADEGEKNKPEKVRPDSSPGAFLKATVFQDHFVSFGFDAELDVFFAGNLVLSPTAETGGRSIVSFGKREGLVTSGFCWPETLDLLAETPFLIHRSVGQGHIIAFTDDPNFRAMYPALQRLFINAAMFGAGH